MADGAAATAAPNPGDVAEEFPFLSRHGPGKGSVRSVMSGKLSLAEIAEIEPPSSLTQEALDEADRAAAAGEDPEDDDTIRAIAHQHIEAQFASGLHEATSPPAEAWQPMLDHEVRAAPGRLRLHQPDQPRHYVLDEDMSERPTTAGSEATFEARMAFGDFDGVHCDPEIDDLADAPQQVYQEFPPQPTPPQAPRERPAPRPTSYFDPMTGQQMLFYPARVPAMLNLPPKLSKKAKAPSQTVRRSKILSAMPEASREARSWLPDPLEGIGGDTTDFMPEGLRQEEVGYSGSNETDQPLDLAIQVPELQLPEHPRHSHFIRATPLMLTPSFRRSSLKSESIAVPSG